MSSNEINSFIDKLHFRTFNLIKDKVKNNFKNIDDEVIKKIIKNRLKDKYIKVKKLKPYYINIFSTTPK